MELQREDDDVQALKREVELLKTLLHQERKKSSSGSNSDTNQRDVSPVRPTSLVKPMPASRFSRTSSSIIKSPQSPASAAQSSETTKEGERSPRRNIALSDVSQRGKSMCWNNSGSGGQTSNAAAAAAAEAAAAAAAAARERALYLQHVPVDTKRGKWWLKDRQILSRNAPSPYDDCVAIKVRETWLWSGRTVIVDKIITCPNALDDVNDDDFDASAFENEQRGERRVVHEEEDEQPYARPSKRSSLPVNASGELYSDSKQFAQEFLQPPKATGSVMTGKQSDATRALIRGGLGNPGRNCREVADVLGVKCDALSRRLRPPKPPRALSKVEVFQSWSKLSGGVGCTLRFPTRGMGFASSFFQLQWILERAHTSIDLCVYSFTHPLLALVRAKARGGVVHVIADAGQAKNKWSEVACLRANGIEVRLDKRTMHEKFCILDGTTVLNGSFNWSRNAVKRNKENIAVTKDWQSISFSLDFFAYWDALDPSNVRVRRPQPKNFFLARVREFSTIPAF